MDRGEGRGDIRTVAVENLDIADSVAARTDVMLAACDGSTAGETFRKAIDGEGFVLQVFAVIGLGG